MTNDQPDGQAAEALAAAILTPDAAQQCQYICQYVTTYQVGGVGGDRERSQCEAVALARWRDVDGSELLVCADHDAWLRDTLGEHEWLGVL